jgi:hypothetical protein
MKSLFITLAIILVACKSNKPPIPVNTMKHILFDMTIADEYYLNKLGSDTNYKKQYPQPTHLYNEVFEKYKLTAKQFYTSLSYYESHPDLMNELLDSTLNTATKNRQILDSTIAKQKK